MIKKKIPCTILQQAKTFKVGWKFSVFVLFEVCFVCHGQELSDIIVSEYISIYIFANVRGSNGMNFVHAIYVKLYLCIYDMIERDSLCLQNLIHIVMFVFCDVYYSLIFITVFLSSVVLLMYFFYRRKNKYVLKVCLTDINRVVIFISSFDAC